MPETPPSYEPPKVSDRRARPSGLLPRNTEKWVVAGIALLMVVIIAFFGRTPPASEPPKAPPATVAVDDPIQARIQEYRARIDEQARRLAAEQGQLAQTQQALESAGD